MQDENPKPSKLKAVFAVVLVVLLIAGVVLTAVYLASQSDDGHTKTAEEFLVTLYTVEEPPAPASQEMVAELAETYSRYLTEDAVTTLLANRTPVRIAQSAADAGVTLECGRVDIQKDDSGDDLYRFEAHVTAHGADSSTELVVVGKLRIDDDGMVFHFSENTPFVTLLDEL